MRNLLFASAFAVAALASAPAFAQGYVGASATNANVEVGPFEDDAMAYDVFGAVVLPTGGPIGIQLNGDVGFSDEDDSEAVFSGTAHAYMQAETHKLGAFVGGTTSDGESLWNVGVEGQYFYDNMNLGGAIGYFSADDVDVDGWGAQGTLTTYLTDNFSLSGNVGYASADAGGFDIDGWSAGVGAEYQLAATPISFFGSYQHGDIEDADLTVDALTVGVTYSFSGTLKERGRTGPSLGGLGGLAGLFF